MARIIIGVMGPGEKATEHDLVSAEKLGCLIAEEQWVLLTGGRNRGVMDAASRGAREAGGLTVGVLPSSDRSGMSPSVDIPIVTGIGSARNSINVLSSDVIIACGQGEGTFSEVLLAAKAGKPVILLNQSDASRAFLKEFRSGRFFFCTSPESAVREVKQLI